MKKKQESEVKATIWKVFSNEEGNYYRLQIEGIKGKRVKNKVMSAVDGWREVGYVWPIDHTEETILLSRNFKEPDSWRKWACQFPFELLEMNRNGKAKKVKFKKRRIDEKT